MVDRDDLAFFAKAMTPSKATTQAGWARLQAAIDAAKTRAEEETASEPVSMAKASKLAIWGGASLLAAAAIAVLALGIGRERWSMMAEESERSQAVDALEGGDVAPLETQPVERRVIVPDDRVASPSRAIAPVPPRADDVPASPDAAGGSITAPVEAHRATPASRAPRVEAARIDARAPRIEAPRIDAKLPRADAAVAKLPPADAAVPTAPVAPEARPVEVPDALALEAASLRHVERALASGQLARARALLRAHRQRFARGLLAREASLLQVVIACEAGEADKAATAARDHSVAFPDDPTAARLRKQICSK
jgi:hypothetical protein